MTYIKPISCYMTMVLQDGFHRFCSYKWLNIKLKLSISTDTKTLGKIDSAHSEIQFREKHLVISTGTGSFRSYKGQVEADGDNFENAREYPQLTLEPANFNKVGEGHTESPVFWPFATSKGKLSWMSFTAGPPGTRTEIPSRDLK